MIQIPKRFAIFATLLMSAPLSFADLNIESAKQRGGWDQRGAVTFLRGPHVREFFGRHREAWKHQAAIHAAHGAAHDVLHIAKLENPTETDNEFDARFVAMTLESPPKSESIMETFGPTVGQFAYDLYRTIDWTHIHHGTTYDILSEPDFSLSEQKKWTDRAVEHYLLKHDLPRSPAPLDVTMRRAGVMMKPYFGYFRNHYPKSSTYFFVAHWWHPAIYEAMILGGKDQDAYVKATDDLIMSVMKDRPQRMLLSREIMPRYSRLSPESANIFDNLHMLHGIAYDILAYPKWSKEEKRAELYRVIKAMSYQPGDEKLARKFSIPQPDMDPRRYEPWMKGVDGEMNRIMMEMLQEMTPMMMPNLTGDQKTRIIQQLRLKSTPGIQEGELEGSLHDAIMKIYPSMKMSPGSMEAGVSSPLMKQMMMMGWHEKYGKLPDIAPLESIGGAK